MNCSGTLKFTGKLELAREIKDIDDQIAELNAGEKKARADSPK